MIPTNNDSNEVRIIMHVDLDYFYAQCEERKAPSLRDKPVVVCQFSGRTEDSGAVATTNYAARKIGARSGISITAAKRRLRGTDAVFLRADHDFYEAVSDSIMKLLGGRADRIEEVSIDEAFLDVSEKADRSFDSAGFHAKMIKAELKSKEDLTCSIGIGPNKLIAKMASDFRKPDGLTIVRENGVRDFLLSLPLGKLYGIGKKTEARMNELGIVTIQDLANHDLANLTKVFGKNLAVYFHNASRGIDLEPVGIRGEREQLSAISTLKQDTHLIDEIMPEMEKLSERVDADAIEIEVSYRSISIIAILNNLSTHTRSKTFDNPVHGREILIKISRELLTEFLEDKQYLVRRIGLRISKLKRNSGQRTLSDFRDV